MKRKTVIAATAVAAAAGIAAYFLTRKRNATKLEPAAKEGGRDKATRAKSTSRAQNYGGAPHTEQDII